MPGSEKKRERDRLRMRAIRASIVNMPTDPPLELLQDMYEAMFVDKWDGTQAPMIGAAYDAARAFLAKPTSDVTQHQ